MKLPGDYKRDDCNPGNCNPGDDTGPLTRYKWHSHGWWCVQLAIFRNLMICNDNAIHILKHHILFISISKITLVLSSQDNSAVILFVSKTRSCAQYPPPQHLVYRYIPLTSLQMFLLDMERTSVLCSVTLHIKFKWYSYAEPRLKK